MKITRPNANTKITTYDSLAEVKSVITNGKINENFKSRGTLSSEDTTRPEFHGTKNLDEALDLLAHGWVDKSQELEKKFQHHVSKEQTAVVRQKSVYDVVGGNCSVPRYLQGVPTNMVRQVRKPAKEKVRTINYNISYNCSVTVKEIEQKAIECLSYVKQLEDSGTRVNLNVYLLSSESYGSKVFGYIIPIKRSTERISIAKMSFALCNASMLRRIIFALFERDLDVPSSFVCGYGTPVRDKKKLQELFPGVEFFG